jgi:preprotein translocase subunit SecA
MARQDKEDFIYKTTRENSTLLWRCNRIIKSRSPGTYGTTSVEISELLSRMLKMRGVTHNVLNAKMQAKLKSLRMQVSQSRYHCNKYGRSWNGYQIICWSKAAGGLAIVGTERFVVLTASYVVVQDVKEMWEVHNSTFR